MNKQQVSRLELYKLLWQQTKSSIAAHYGVKLRVINIATEEMNIPSPPQGYWTKTARGSKYDIPPLPDTNKPTKAVFSFLPYLHINQDSPPKSARLATKNNLHSVTEKNIQYFKKFREWERGMVLPEDNHAFGFPVTKKSVDKAMRIMNTLTWVFEEKGWEFWSVRPKHPHMRIKIGDEEIVFTLKEPTKRKNYELTQKEQREKERGLMSGTLDFNSFPQAALTLLNAKFFTIRP